MLLSFLFLIAGLLLVVKGADWLVDGASSLAKKYKVPDLAIGLTVVAFGTSAPELVVNTFAAYEGKADIVFGNVIGSNNFNLFIILGLAGIITPLAVQSSSVWKEIPLSFLAIFMVWLFANDFLTDEAPQLSRLDGILLLLLFGLFLFYVFKQLKSDPTETEVFHKSFSTLKTWSYILFGMAGLILGGRLVVIYATQIASSLGVSEKIIGLTIVAAGTSLPELVTSLVAAIKKNNDIAVGNIVGSNIFNFFLILGASSLIRPVQYDTIFNTDLYILAGGTLFLFIAMFTGKKHKLDRWEAILLLLVYLGYMAWLVWKEI